MAEFVYRKGDFAEAWALLQDACKGCACHDKCSAPARYFVKGARKAVAYKASLNYRIAKEIKNGKT